MINVGDTVRTIGGVGVVARIYTGVDSLSNPSAVVDYCIVRYGDICVTHPLSTVTLVK